MYPLPKFPLRCHILFKTSVSNFNVGYKTWMSNVKIKATLKLGCQILMFNSGGDITPQYLHPNGSFPGLFPRGNEVVYTQLLHFACR